MYPNHPSNNPTPPTNNPKQIRNYPNNILNYPKLPSLQGKAGGSSTCGGGTDVVEIWLQPTPPPENWLSRENWLPTPEGATYQLTMRIYWPDDAVLGGEWQMPSLEMLRD
jgi:hypothetical protein